LALTRTAARHASIPLTVSLPVAQAGWLVEPRAEAEAAVLRPVRAAAAPHAAWSARGALMRTTDMPVARLSPVQPQTLWDAKGGDQFLERVKESYTWTWSAERDTELLAKNKAAWTPTADWLSGITYWPKSGCSFSAASSAEGRAVRAFTLPACADASA